MTWFGNDTVRNAQLKKCEEMLLRHPFYFEIGQNVTSDTKKVKNVLGGQPLFKLRSAENCDGHFCVFTYFKDFWNQVRNDSAHRVQFFKKKLCKWLRTSEKRLLGPFWKEKNFATTFELVIGVCSVHFSNSLPTIFPTKNSFRKCFKCSMYANLLPYRSSHIDNFTLLEF